ncbi:hypothetical protein DFH06DRAFT_1428360 [Mycena polygramma]|nr:hypothetical protein DFH06DRAFT_1428360 [Mycena polygramma]
MSTAHNALKIQELCDHIAYFLQESKRDLRACSVVSPAFTSAAQRHLFREIIVNRGTLYIDDVSMLGRYDEPQVTIRLCAVLKASPHLLPFIRRMRLSLEVAVLKPLSQLEFPNLCNVVFHRRRGGAIDEETISLAAKLIGAQAITRVGLIATLFNNMHDMGRLFERHTPALQSIYLHDLTVKKTVVEGERMVSTASRAQIKTLQWAWQYLSESKTVYVLDPLFPFDLSALTTLSFGPHLSPPIDELVNNARHTLTHLAVDAQDLGSPRSSNSQPRFLAQLPALTDLTIVSPGHELADAETLLASLPSQHRLRSLTLQIKKVCQLNEEQMRPVAAACDRLQNACIVMVWVRRFVSGADGIDAGALIYNHRIYPHVWVAVGFLHSLKSLHRSASRLPLALPPITPTSDGFLSNHHNCYARESEYRRHSIAHAHWFPPQFLFLRYSVGSDIYRLCFPRDPWAVKLLVYSMLLAMTVCTCLNGLDVQSWYGKFYGQIRGLSSRDHSSFYSPIMGSIIAAVVQLFFCYRIIVIKRAAWPLCVLIVIHSVMQTVGGIGVGIMSFELQFHTRAVGIFMRLWLIPGPVADVLIASAMTYLLLRVEVAPKTRDIVKDIVSLILETNMFSAAVAIIGLVLYLAVFEPYCAAPIFMLPGIYANTLLATLNNRVVIKRLNTGMKSEISCVTLNSVTATTTSVSACGTTSERTAHCGASVESACSGPISFVKPVVDESRSHLANQLPSAQV